MEKPRKINGTGHNPEFLEYLLRRRIDYWSIKARQPNNEDMRAQAQEIIGQVRAQLRSVRIAKATDDQKAWPSRIRKGGD